MSNKNIFLVTGGKGLLGTRLVSLLNAKVAGCHIIVVDKDKTKAPWEDKTNIEVIISDLCDEKLWDELPNTITHVFHLAANIPWKASEKNKTSIRNDNILPLTHLIEHSNKWKNLKQVIFSSSISLYVQSRSPIDEKATTNPNDIYAASKLDGEKMLMHLALRGVKVVALRYSSLYAVGQHQGTVLPTMINTALSKKEIVVHGDGNRTQDFLYCEDAANANILAYEKKAQGSFNIGSGVAVTMTQPEETIKKIFMNNTAKVIHITKESCQTIGYNIDISKAKQELGYNPGFQIESGLLKLKEEMEGVKI